jgi:hypothetical protein
MGVPGMSRIEAAGKQPDRHAAIGLLKAAMGLHCFEAHERRADI